MKRFLFALAVVATLGAGSAIAQEPEVGEIVFNVTGPDGEDITFCVFVGEHNAAQGNAHNHQVSTGESVERPPFEYDAHFTMFGTSFCPERSFTYAELWYDGATDRDHATPISVTAGNQTVVTATLGPPIPLTGSVHLNNSATSDGPCANADIRIRREEPDGGFELYYLRAEDGSFEAELPPGNYQAFVNCGGHATPVPDWTHFTADYGDSIDIEVTYVPSVYRELTVTDLQTGQLLGPNDGCFDILFADGSLFYELKPVSGVQTAPLNLPAGSEYVIRFRDCKGQGYQSQYYGSTVTLATATVISDTSPDRVDLHMAIGPAGARCQGRLPTIMGTSSADELMGTDGDDTIMGLAGDDFIDGGLGNDIICGELGNDTLLGGVGHDQLDGGPGADVLRGGNGIDRLSGGPSNDQLFGEQSVDKLMGGAGADLIDGGNKRDIGDYRIAPSGISVHLANGVGTAGEAEGDTLISIEKIAGSQFDDVIVGDDGNNVLFGWAGFDIIDGLGGNDVCRFGEQITNCERP